jgi:hypothetical protein
MRYQKEFDRLKWAHSLSDNQLYIAERFWENAIDCVIEKVKAEREKVLAVANLPEPVEGLAGVARDVSKFSLLTFDDLLNTLECKEARKDS